MPLTKITAGIAIVVFSAAFFTAANVNANDTAPTSSDGQIRLTFLGTGAPRPSTERYGASILVEAGKHRLLVDAGPGMRERLFEAGGFDYIVGVDHILVTHLHYDHTLSIPGLWLTGWLFGRRVPLRVQGPIGTAAMMAKLQQAYEWDVAYRAIVGVPLAGIGLEASDVAPGIIFDQDGLQVTAFEVQHMPIDIDTGERLDLPGQTLGFRIDYEGRSILFSGDTRSTPDSEIVKYGQGVDVLIHEVQVPSPGTSKEAQLANISLSVHSTPEQAANIFSLTKPRMAVYSHIIPPNTTTQDLIDATRPIYIGPLTVAHDLMTITIGQQIEIGESERTGSDVFEKSGVLK